MKILMFKDFIGKEEKYLIDHIELTKKAETMDEDIVKTGIKKLIMKDTGEDLINDKSFIGFEVFDDKKTKKVNGEYFGHEYDEYIPCKFKIFENDNYFIIKLEHSDKYQLLTSFPRAIPKDGNQSKFEDKFIFDNSVGKYSHYATYEGGMSFTKSNDKYTLSFDNGCGDYGSTI